MKVSTLIYFVEFFAELLFNAAERHERRAADLREQAAVLEAEAKDNAAEAMRAKTIADRIAKFIGD